MGLLDALNLTRPNLAGWSYGACASLRLAAQHPERIGKASGRRRGRGGLSREVSLGASEPLRRA